MMMSLSSLNDILAIIACASIGIAVVMLLIWLSLTAG
jgi:hypothetical protein